MIKQVWDVLDTRVVPALHYKIAVVEGRQCAVFKLWLDEAKVHRCQRMHTGNTRYAPVFIQHLEQHACVVFEQPVCKT